MKEFIVLIFIVSPTVLLFSISFSLIEIKVRLKQISDILNAKTKDFRNDAND